MRIDAHVWVAGTTATDARSELVGRDDPYAQTVQALKNIEAALRKAGASLPDVVRTRMYVTDIREWEAVARAHGECFGDIRPVKSMVEVSKLIAPGMVIQIEAEAFVIEATDDAEETR